MAGCKGQDVSEKPDGNGETSKTDDEDKTKDKEDDERKMSKARLAL